MKYSIISITTYLALFGFTPVSNAYLATDFPINTPNSRRAVVQEQKQVFDIYNSSSTVFKKRQQATTGFTGRFYLLKSSVQSANLRNANRQFLSAKRNGSYRNVTAELSTMSDARLSSQIRNTVRMNRRSIQNQAK